MFKAEKLKDFEAEKFGSGFVSEKFNGIHGTYDPQTGTMFSRTPRAIKGLSHIEEALAATAKNFYVMGEIVIPNKSFQEASGLIRSYNPTPTAQFFIFNIMAVNEKPGFTFKRRHLVMKTLFKSSITKSMPINLIDFNPVEKLEDYDAIHQDLLNEGAEGTCWVSSSHLNAPGCRRWDWMKRIEIIEKEVKVIGINPGTEGKQYEKSLGSFHCLDENGKDFNVGIFKGQGKSWRQQVYDNKEFYIGSYITIQYKNYTTRGVPYQPRFKDFRWDL